MLRDELKQSRVFRGLRHLVGRAVADFNLIEAGDRIAVAVSGGKDSYTLLLLLEELRRRAPVRFELLVVIIDPGYPGFKSDEVADFIRSQGVACHVERSDHYGIIAEKRRPGSSYCSFCARMRRGALYGMASRLGCNKLALGHHRDDFIETLLLNQFFVGSLKAMSARMLADNGETVVIRPLVYVPEDDIVSFVAEAGLTTVSCACPMQSQDDLQRRRMKLLLRQLEQDIPQVRNSLLAALSNVHPRHLLDPALRRDEYLS
ncbi:MAG TPA: tRNA 2-thiocytidine(32) synthetase TtcA [Deltaproteobacteria bacterium]|nr:tRNA 2-thiocytidine(32) synthetase TtcA [Deltaproteobacteria bacterium]